MLKKIAENFWRAVMTVFSRETHSSDNFRLLHILTMMRLFAAVSFAYRFAAIGFPTIHPPSVSLLRSTVFVALALYSVAAVTHLFFAYRRPLMVLDTHIYTVYAYGELVLVSILYWASGNIVSYLLLFYLLPIGLLGRMKPNTFMSRRLRLSQRNIVVDPLLLSMIPLIPAFLMRVITDHWSWSAFLSNVPFVSLILGAVSTTMWRHWRVEHRGTTKSNLRFITTVIRNKLKAEAVFLRALDRSEDKRALFLVSATPPTILAERSNPRFASFGLDSQHPSIAVASFMAGKTQSMHSQEELRNMLHLKSLVQQFSLESGVAWPLPNQTGTVSAYWQRTESVAVLHLNDLRDIADYLEQEKETISQLIEAEKETLKPISDWDTANQRIYRMLSKHDYWDSAHLLVETMAKHVSSPAASILFYDEDNLRFRSYPSLGSYGPADFFSFATGRRWEKCFSKTALSIELVQSELPRALQDGHVYVFPLRIKEGDGDQWKWMGIVFVWLPADQMLTTLQQSQLESLALTGSFDLRNCQLYFKSRTRLDVQELLNNFIPQLFRFPTELTNEQTFLRTLADPIRNTLKAHSCSLGLCIPDATCNRLRACVAPHSLSDYRFRTISFQSKNEINQMHSRKGKIHIFDYDSPNSPTDPFVARNGIRRSYGLGFNLDSNNILILYVNYQDPQLETSYRTRIILEDLQPVIVAAWENWQRSLQQLAQQKVHTRALWRDDMHDQLNQLQSRVLRPLEALQYKMTNDASPYRRRVDEIHKAARLINSILKQMVVAEPDPILAERGLIPALVHLKGAFPRLEIKVIQSHQPDARVATPLYRIVREAITNGFKHGGRRVAVTVNAHPHRIEIQVLDDGPGYDGVRKQGSGVNMMRYQAEVIGAQLTWNRLISPRGTLIKIVHPS